ncbi:unnamed protein product [Tilletia caries]|uniref:DUF8040 domain-containing protein n=1 Tax=Tilletia caries TaxID=13290 RepID=A0ABN7J4G2_9BASI|nr:unnamed protein product [Tilletia caries]CAD6952812.1 unnamed protein product [Tilletia caries]
MLGMHPSAFRALERMLRNAGLADSKYMSAREKLGIFLYMSRYGGTTRLAADTFGRSPNTIARPQDHKELYNRRHAGARSVVERAFGVIQARFKVLKTGIQFSTEAQAALPLPLCTTSSAASITTTFRNRWKSSRTKW